MIRAIVLAGMLALGAVAGYGQGAVQGLQAAEGTWVAPGFRFTDGESLKELRLHYRTLGKPHRGADGRVDNAVMILHGTGGTGAQFLGAGFAGVLFGPGELLDAAKYFVILPDGIGHGGSSKPSDGMHAKFPHYDYDDMVRGQHLLLTEGLHVDHLRLLAGTSMGCMHAFVWGERYPEFADALMPLACQPVAISGRNRIMRKMAMDAITSSPDYDGGEYKAQPSGMKTAVELLLVMGSAPLYMQAQLPTRDAADKFLADYLATRVKGYDANDFLYQFDASRNYDPSPGLEKILVPLTQINSADDFINPPELGISERMMKRVPKGKFVLLPVTAETRGHGTHTLPAIWKGYLAELMERSGREGCRRSTPR